MSFDPGGGTGYAIWFGDLDKPWNPDDVVMGSLDDKDHHLKLEELLQATLTVLSIVPPLFEITITHEHGVPVPPRSFTPPKRKRVAVPNSRVVFEGFDNTGNIAAELISLEYIGVIKAFCQKYDIKHFRATRSGKDVAYLKGQGLKSFGLWPNSKDAKDAARHLVWHLANVLDYQDLFFYRQRYQAGHE